MMKKIKILLLSAALSFMPLFIFTPAFAHHTPQHSVQQGACGAAGQPSCDPNEATNTINRTVENVINILSIVIGIIAVIVIILAGFRYITSAGNEQTIAAAKKTLIYAIVGLVIVALAQMIVRFVLSNL
jgi:hypothetical protein